MNYSIKELQPIAIHTGEGQKFKVFREKDYTIITIDSRTEYQEIKFRNVGDTNPDAMIQFTCVEESKIGKAPRYLAFGIPASLVELFIKSLQFQKP